MAEEEKQVEDTQEENEENIDNEETVEGEDTKEITVPERVTRLAPEIANEWGQLTPNKRADVVLRLAEFEKPKTLIPDNPKKGAEEPEQNHQSDRQIPVYNFDTTEAEIVEMLDNDDNKGVASIITGLFENSFRSLHAINSELSNQAQSQIPRDIQLALDSVPRAQKTDIPEATKIINSGRAIFAVDAISLAVQDREGLNTEQVTPERKIKSRRASNHGKGYTPGTLDVALTTNNDCLIELEIAAQEAESKSRK